VVDDAGRDHEAWVERPACNTAERVPCAIIEPIPEVVEAIVDQVLRCSEVEPRIELMNDALESYDREQSAGNSGSSNGHQDY